MDITTELAASIWQISVSPGESVVAGQTIMVLESMKMEIPVDSPIDGSIGEILVSEGDAVNEGHIVARVLPLDPTTTVS